MENGCPVQSCTQRFRAHSDGACGLHITADPGGKGEHSNIFDIQRCLNELLEGLYVPLLPHIPVSEPLAQYNALYLPVRANADK